VRNLGQVALSETHVYLPCKVRVYVLAALALDEMSPFAAGQLLRAKKARMSKKIPNRTWLIPITYPKSGDTGRWRRERRRLPKRRWGYVEQLLSWCPRKIYLSLYRRFAKTAYPPRKVADSSFALKPFGESLNRDLEADVVP
jgi:hypothetical protein